MKAYWKTFSQVLMGMLQRPMWMMLLISLCIMSLVYAKGGIWDLPVGVVDNDHSPASQRLVRYLDAAPKIKVVMYDNLEQAKRDLGWRRIFAVMILPTDLEKKIIAGKDVTVPVYGDATNRLPNGQIQLDVQTAYQELVAQYNTQLMMNQGFSEAQARMILTPIRNEVRDVFNPGISFAAITFPGLLIMLLQHSLLIASFRVSLVLRSHGKPPLPVYLGGLSALIPIWLFLSIVLFVLWPWVLGYRQTASIPVILMLTFPFLLSVLGLSKLVTECLRRVELIYLTLSFITMPVFYLSGTIWPHQAQPDWVRLVADLIPSVWATRAIAGVNQMGLHYSDVLPDLLMLLILGCVYTLLGIGVALLRDGRTLREKLGH